MKEDVEEKLSSISIICHHKIRPNTNLIKHNIEEKRRKKKRWKKKEV